MPVTKLDTAVLSILEDKIQVIQTDDQPIYLVGPIRLPVNLYGETVVFQWYCWLHCDAGTNTEEIIQKLSSSNLAERQQSSVLVYGDFAYSDDALIRMHSICHTGIFLAVNVVIVAFNYVNR